MERKKVWIRSKSYPRRCYWWWRWWWFKCNCKRSWACSLYDGEIKSNCSRFRYGYNFLYSSMCRCINVSVYVCVCECVCTEVLELEILRKGRQTALWCFKRNGWQRTDADLENCNRTANGWIDLFPLPPSSFIRCTHLTSILLYEWKEYSNRRKIFYSH